ncbi:hypothetical protein [Aquibacillus sediminis]|uniref:hypothetical protein n=1 Tax=Aquibacillus sediminis TaxID=2574734 RepID=UPI001109D323|nr:hypothetical protein [Aquibacillus sediminis]
MDELIGAILPILAVVAWLFGSFKNDEENKKPTKKPNQPRPRPTPTPSGSGQRQTTTSEPKVEPKSTVQQSQQQPVDTRTKSYYEKKQEQIEKLKEQVAQTSEITKEDSIHDAIKEESTPKAYKKYKSNRNSNLSVATKINKKGLAESVVMSEILGPPKAVKPHQSVLQMRKNKNQ